MATATRTRETPDADGRTTPAITLLKSRPSCERSRRCVSRPRRETGAGKRNWISASEKSSNPLSNGNNQPSAVTASSPSPTTPGAALRIADSMRIGGPTLPARRR